MTTKQPQHAWKDWQPNTERRDVLGDLTITLDLASLAAWLITQQPDVRITIPARLVSPKKYLLTLNNPLAALEAYVHHAHNTDNDDGSS